MKKGIQVNHKIPRTMTLEGLCYLGAMAKLVPENGIIVEVGPLYGSSTWVLAKNAHPSVKIFSIDTWQDEPWVQSFRLKKYPDAPPLSIDAFKRYTEDCTNIYPIQGWAPDVVSASWDNKIDLFFDDASHGNPGLQNNLNFFKSHLNNKYIICGDDYSSGWRDIISEVTLLSESLNQDPYIMGRVWGISNHPLFSSSIFKILNDSEINTNVSIKFMSGEETLSDGIFWSGKLHKFDIANKIKIFFNNLKRGLNVTGTAIYSDNTVLMDTTLDGKNIIEFSRNEKIIGLKFSLSGIDSKNYQIKYQIGTINMMLGKNYPNSKLVTGPMQVSVDQDSFINALRLFVIKKDEINH
ncbi:class I SAM-dependent methyltransferase [Polynucleobacter sp.]|uniref:class I SAM-dependent methyltransferase n=1 Tax=Polynucleobacter sp. TaxID=2029855 RepID=UPI002735E7F3|nr:class I SAM-dependent methyltransferase [Polynucleobacter sp.]MDP3122552.1 hypothetical protein [Polynucleobacter sp.]